MKPTIISFVVLAGCAPGVPDAPSYQQHVAPILAANCVRCHGVPVLGGAPQGECNDYDEAAYCWLRLDTHGDHEAPRTRDVGTYTAFGAARGSQRIAARVASDVAPMPPRFGLDDYQIETLQAWDAAGAPRGAPNPGNRPPTATVQGVAQTIEEDGVDIRVRYLIDVDVRDVDPDIVGGGLRVVQGATTLPIGLVRSGPNRVAWDTTAITPGTFALEAVLDDGAAEVIIPLGQIDVEAP